MTRIFDVPGISFGHCRETIEHVVADVPGVTDVRVDIDARTVTIDATTSDDRLRSAIHDAGYEVSAQREC